jgi:hypothetical protein
MKVFKLKRGRRHTKYGYRKKDLKPYQIDYFDKHKLVRKHVMRDKRYTQILLRIIEYEHLFKDHLKLYYNNYTHRVSSYDEIMEDSKMFDWKCCICECELKCEIANFEINNFLCETCSHSYGNPETSVDSRILESSVKFRQYCQMILLDNQKKFTRFIRFFKRGKSSKKAPYQEVNNQSK